MGPESCKRAIRGGFAAMTPQRSGAATTSASVIGTPCVVATSLLLRQADGEQTSESVKNAGVSNLTVPKGWNSAHLFSREDAGIYTAHNTNALVMVSAPTPDISRSFGSSLHLTRP